MREQAELEDPLSLPSPLNTNKCTLHDMEDLGVVDPSKHSHPMISYGLFSYSKIPEPIMEKIQSLFVNTLLPLSRGLRLNLTLP